MLAPLTIFSIEKYGLPAVFVARSLAGAPLGEAAARALEADAAFDLGALLARAVGAGLLRGFTLCQEPQDPISDENPR